MSNKEITKKSYQATAEKFTNNTADLAPKESIEKFVGLLPAKAKIVDIGCGPGRDAAIFSDKGLDVLGIDFCQNLIDIAKAKAPKAKFQLADIETNKFPAESFDGAWAGSSLSHISKEKLPAVLKEIHSSLKPHGYFYMTLRQGIGEKLETDTRYEGNFQKFWSHYEEEEIKALLQTLNFKILECTTVKRNFAYPTFPMIRVFCQK